MAETINLGIVGIKNVGEYDSQTAYEKLNVVTYQGSSYCALKSTVGNLPTDSEYWQLYAEKGDKGDTGEKGDAPVKGIDYWTSSDIADIESTLESDVTSEVTSQLSSLTSATPLVASSTAGMTDTSRIYVNTTDGHWYWYDGTEWQDGGVYQATEDPEVENARTAYNENTYDTAGNAIRNQILSLQKASVSTNKQSFFAHLLSKLYDCEILKFENKDFRASSTSSWQSNSYVEWANLPVTPGDILNFGYFESNGLGQHAGVIQYFRSDNTEMTSYTHTSPKSEVDDDGFYMYTSTVPYGAATCRIRLYGIGNASTAGTPPVVGNNYYIHGAFLIKGDLTNYMLTNGAYFKFTDFSKLPNYDTTNRTLTIYEGTIYENIYTKHSYTVASDITLSWDTEYSTTGNLFVFDESNDTFSLVRYNKSNNLKDKILLGSLSRDGESSWCVCGLTIDNHVQNLGTIPYENLDSFTKNLIMNNQISLPDNWEDKVETIKNNQNSNFTFAIQTDNHFYLQEDYTYAGTNISVLSNKVGMDFVANLGDMIRGYADDLIDNTDNMKASLTYLIERYVRGLTCPLLMTIGNHDNNVLYAIAKNDNSYIIPKKELFSRITQFTKNSCPNIVLNNYNSLYYYVDIKDYRVIMLNTSDGSDTELEQIYAISNEQLNWFTNIALNTTKKLIIMCHIPLVSQLTSNVVTNRDNIISAVNTFISNGGTVIGYFYGHQHNQTNAVVDGINHICFKNYSQRAEVVIIDEQNSKIKTYGLGDSVNNREFNL